MTLARLDHERGTEYRRYIWAEDGSLRGMSASRIGPLRFLPVVDGDFELYEDGAPSRRVSFAASEGNVVMEFGPDASYRAQRPGGLPRLRESK